MKSLKAQRTMVEVRPQVLNMLGQLSPMLGLQLKQWTMIVTLDSGSVELKFREDNDAPAAQRSSLRLIAALCYPESFAEELQEKALNDSEASGMDHYHAFVSGVERRGYEVHECFEESSDDYSPYHWGSGFKISKQITNFTQVLTFLTDLQEMVREFQTIE